jgi:hypothetical protein
MIKTFLKIFLLLPLSFSGLVSSASAVGVEYDGYFRFRQNFNHNLNMDRNEGPNWRNYSDFRFRLNPSFFVTDTVRIHTSLNFMDGTFGDTPFRGAPYGNPAQRNDLLFNDPQSNTVGRSIPQNEQSSWVYGGASAPDGAVTTTDLQPLQVRRAWAEVELPVGLLKVGRMPFHFGLGIFGNSGDEIDQEIGSTRDRVKFETMFGNYYMSPGFSWINEGTLDSGKDDGYEYFLEFGRNTEQQSLGLYLAQFSQSEDSVLNANSTGEKTKYWVIDLFGRRQFEKLSIETEIALFTGKFTGRDLFAVNGVGRLSGNGQKFNWNVEGGLSTGTSTADAASNKVKSYAFNRDYNIALILFNEALPGGSSLPNEGEGDGRPVAPHSGAISNAMYGKVFFEYEVNSYFQPELHLIAPFAMQTPAGTNSRFYGFEYNIVTRWTMNDYTSAVLSFAHLLPGNLYKGVSEAESVVLVRAGLNLEF